ncbi:hypothetical protein GCU56_12160 [Geodermatophilus sabuli]|uniref:Uncharacterized protein n=1 Tax=Geodermatophilus sabuli TaxID=1564158 RepID=A0A7K3W174_9ACTN|nr:hypothetical protein [Geodermatophilus sabuli]NEK58621.1 hypothetical protein [Geodermatophilus sabuli]
MEWALVAAVGFVLSTVLVVLLARANTARWEGGSRTARAAIRAREEAARRVRAAALLAHRSPRAVRRQPRLPHPHLPPSVADRLAHSRGALHQPRVRVHLPRRDGRLARRLTPRRASRDRSGSDAGDSGT